MHLSVTPGIVRGQPAGHIPAMSIKLRCLERVCTGGHLRAAPDAHLLLGSVEQPSAETASALVVADPKHRDVATSAPCPSRQPGDQDPVATAKGDAQEPAVGHPGGFGIELI